MSASVRSTGLLAIACAALLLLLLVPANAIAQPAAPVFGPCRSTQVFVRAPGLQCGTLDVPFDRANSAAGEIALAVQRVPASAPRTGVIVLLAGGPGQPALPAFEALLAPLAHEAALRGFELVAFDQRGTGQSERLQCPEVGEPLKGGPGVALGACGTALGATRALYTSQESVEDLDALRQALGGTPLSLFAVSYGGRVAGMYAREHPQGVARMVLDSPAPLTDSDPLGRERMHAMRRVLDEGVCGAGACRSFSADLYADLARLVARLHRHPLRTSLYDDRGRLRRVTLTERGVLSMLLQIDLLPGTRKLAPAAIAAAANGDPAPLARLTEAQPEISGGSVASSSARSAFLDDGLSHDVLGGEPFAASAPASDAEIPLALFAATYCDENELPWAPDSAPASRAAIR